MSAARINKPDGLLSKWKIMGLILVDDRTRIIHAKVAIRILDRCRFGSARASVSYLATATGLTRGSVATATTDLVEWGYFTRRMGSGKRPTEYIPNWSIVLSPQDATSVLQPQDEFVLQPQDAKSPSVLQPQDQSRLPVPLTKAVTGKEGHELTHGGATTTAGAVGAADGGAPWDPFTELFDAYAVRRDKAKAREAYEKAAPDADQHQAMLAGARAWREEYDRHGRPMKYRKSLASWIAREDWDCDPDGPVQDHKAEATKKKRAAPASKNVKASKSKLASPANEPQPVAASEHAPRPSMADLAPGAPKGRHVVTIAAATVKDGDGEKLMDLRLEGVPCGAFNHSFAISSDDYQRQEDGQRKLGQIINALGIHPIEDTSELVGSVLLAEVRADGSVRYEPIAANDNAAQAAQEAA